MESVILSSPILLVLYILSLLLSLYDVVRKTSGYVFPLLSALVFTGTTAYALILGAGFEETGLVVLIFLAVNLGAFAKTGGKK